MDEKKENENTEEKNEEDTKGKVETSEEKPKSPKDTPKNIKKEEKFNLIEEAKKTAERIEAGNIKNEELLKKIEEIEARNILGGRSEAGHGAPKKETEHEKWEKDAKLRYAGTGLDPT